MDSIIILALSATAIAKTLVDLARMSSDLPRWTPPVMAIIVGIGAVALMMLAEGTAFTAQLWGSIILAGILAGGQAVGVTELQKRATAVQDVRDAAAIDKANRVISSQ